MHDFIELKALVLNIFCFGHQLRTGVRTGIASHPMRVLPVLQHVRRLPPSLSENAAPKGQILVFYCDQVELVITPWRWSEETSNL